MEVVRARPPHLGYFLERRLGEPGELLEGCEYLAPVDQEPEAVRGDVGTSTAEVGLPSAADVIGVLPGMA